MGWQARLPKDQKPEFVRTCNKCGGTGVRLTFISVAGIPTREEAKCSCVKKNKIILNLPISQTTSKTGPQD